MAYISPLHFQNSNQCPLAFPLSPALPVRSAAPTYSKLTQFAGPSNASALLCGAGGANRLSWWASGLLSSTTGDRTKHFTAPSCSSSLFSLFYPCEEYLMVVSRAVRLIEIELQSRFETLRFANRKACDVDAILLCSRAYAWLPALSGSLTNQ